ncbi:hypothetical protein GA0115253_108614 [Streptomyces sp. Termitarium-T10T-6]|nr:hypothetical protein GA0115253_108614 [Streptomyces sp. Termitarium-T10T-6]
MTHPRGPQGHPAGGCPERYAAPNTEVNAAEGPGSVWGAPSSLG